MAADSSEVRQAASFIMVLVDTSIWADHLRAGVVGLEGLLNNTEAYCHPHVVCELACGCIKNRPEIFSLLLTLPLAPVLEFDEYLYFIDAKNLAGKGLGYVDIHLLASAQLSGLSLWSFDKKLNNAAVQLGLSY